MNTLPTAEEFAKQHHPMKTYPADWNVMIEFAKLHVEAALKLASENAEIIDDPNSYTGNTGSKYPPDQIISKDSILNAYPLDNIK